MNVCVKHVLCLYLRKDIQVSWCTCSSQCAFLIQYSHVSVRSASASASAMYAGAMHVQAEAGFVKKTTDLEMTGRLCQPKNYQKGLRKLSLDCPCSLICIEMTSHAHTLYDCSFCNGSKACAVRVACLAKTIDAAMRLLYKERLVEKGEEGGGGGARLLGCM